MKWLDLHPEAWAKLGTNEPSAKSSKVKLIPDGSYTEIMDTTRKKKYRKSTTSYSKNTEFLY